MTDWISVKDRLPEEGVSVLSYDAELKEMRVDHIMISPRDEEPYVWVHMLVTDWGNVTHWMPLPGMPDADKMS